jgi:hypothetical protein
MSNQFLPLAGASITFIWGIKHLFPTKAVLRRFGDISQDNKYIITMEWFVEGDSLIFMGVLVAGVTLIDNSSPISLYVYIISIAMLFTLAIISLFSGFKVNFLPFKLCPIIFTLSLILIILGLLL